MVWIKKQKVRHRRILSQADLLAAEGISEEKIRATEGKQKRKLLSSQLLIIPPIRLGWNSATMAGPLF